MISPPRRKGSGLCSIWSPPGESAYPRAAPSSACRIHSDSGLHSCLRPANRVSGVGSAGSRCSVSGAFWDCACVCTFLAPRADPYLLPVTALLCGLGILMIYRLDPDRAFLQSLWLGVGIVFFIVVLVSARHLERLAEYKYLLGLAGLALLIFTIVVAPETHGARLWVRIGGIGFQPSEFA